jgi:polar amino acid transport system substrate-binding protein
MKTIVNMLSTAAVICSTTLGSLAPAYAASCTNETWSKLRERSKIVVGIKSDAKPWGFIDTDGKLVGMEADMAREVADTIGVDLELVGVQSSNRMQFHEQGKIDLMIEIIGVVRRTITPPAQTSWRRRRSASKNGDN